MKDGWAGGVVGVVGVRRRATENVEHDERNAPSRGRGRVGVHKAGVGMRNVR